jgi:uncharacterized protein (TIGR04222 family)
MWRPRLLLAAAIAASAASPLAADEGWVINRLEIRLDIGPGGTVSALDAVDVDFRGLSRHGIFRDITYRQDFDQGHTREYDISLLGVTAADGRRHRVETSTEGAQRRFRIGDPNRTISGRETYRIAYRIGHALNAFADHDELYWNASGTWPVAVEAASVTVHAPGEAIEQAGSAEHCEAHFTATEAVFTATRPLEAGEQITIVTGLHKGAVVEPRPLLVAKARDVGKYFDVTPALLSLMVVAFAAVVGGVGTLWWRIGRDRRYVTMHYLSQEQPDHKEERTPLLGSEPIAVEFEPPDHIRPGQMGVLIDERADTLDVTATIIDLAVRGYLSIKELPKKGWFGSADWQLDRLKDADSDLLEYERIVLHGLFDSTQSRKLSDLKNKFYDDLAKAKTALYKDAVGRGWFPRNPNAVRVVYRLLGVLAAIAGVGLTVLLGSTWGAGLLGLPVIAGGVILAIVAGAMPRRTAAGREVVQRTLGFARYIKTAETHQQAFAERANIFTAYLPYAIVFKCVERWARAFKDIDMQAATAAWYVGSSPFNPGTFSSSMGSFSTSVSGAIASTPGGSGSSGLGGGGSSGGGGSGGGGGSW